MQYCLVPEAAVSLFENCLIILPYKKISCGIFNRGVPKLGSVLRLLLGNIRTRSPNVISK